MTWLVTGGAGYVGGPVVRALLGDGRRVVVLDDLSTGDPATVPPAVPLVRASVTDIAAVRRALLEHGVTGVVHLAGRKSVAESVAQPLTYYRQNVGGTLALVEAMASAKVGRLVLSSSAAVYGAPDSDTIDEESPTCPMNPYGATKLMSEWIVCDAALAHGLRHVILRYFNVAGVDATGRRAPADTGLVPCALDAVARGERPAVFGGDYPTPDGSCVRDFVHVLDIASAHALAARALEEETCTGVFNVGSGVGYSVGQVLDAVRAFTGVAFDEEIQARRPGDPARVVASVEKIRRELGWRPRHGLAEMVGSEWLARLGGGPARTPTPIAERQARVVVVSASAGAGHDRAAAELGRRLRERGFQVDCVDLVRVFPGRLGLLLRGTYRGMLSRMPWIYGTLFLIGSHLPGASSITRALLRPVRARLLRTLPPDTCAVVPIYPLSSQILGPLHRSGQLSVPVITYLTDFAVNPFWVSPGVDAYCAAHEVSRQQAQDLGATETLLAGRLVQGGFRPGSAEAKRDARRRFGLPPDEPLALLVAGSWGVGQVSATAAEIGRSGTVAPVVVCGANSRLYQRLRRDGVAHVLGWVDDMPDLLHAVDVLVENAGGLTALEAMACGVPVATYRPIPGHGKANAAAMARAGVATWVRRRADLGRALVELINGERGRQQVEAGLALFESDPAGVIADAAKGLEASETTPAPHSYPPPRPLPTVSPGPDVAVATEAAQPVAAQPVAAQPVAAQPVAAQPVAAQPGAAQPGAAHPVAGRPTRRSHGRRNAATVVASAAAIAISVVYAWNARSHGNRRGPAARVVHAGPWAGTGRGRVSGSSRAAARRVPRPPG